RTNRLRGAGRPAVTRSWQPATRYTGLCCDGWVGTDYPPPAEPTRPPVPPAGQPPADGWQPARADQDPPPASDAPRPVVSDQSEATAYGASAYGAASEYRPPSGQSAYGAASEYRPSSGQSAYGAASEYPPPSGQSAYAPPPDHQTYPAPDYR